MMKELEQKYIKKNNITLIKSYWFEANHNDITIEKLQNLINSFYNSLLNSRTWKDILLAFQYYIVFEKIHPFPDYNGRIGRLIFLEHPFEYINFPVSNALNKLCISQDDLFNTTLKTYYYKNNKLYYYKNNEKFIYSKYNFNESDLETLTDKQLIKINEIIVKSILINLFMIAALLFSGRNYYYYASLSLQILSGIIIFVTLMMIFFRKDGRGIHDVVTGTKVIQEN